MSIVNRLTQNDFAELCGVLCPYCRAGLPIHDNTRSADEREIRAFIHTIPGADHAFVCRAGELRHARTVTPYRMPPE